MNVLIIENDEIARKLLTEHFCKGGAVTAAYAFSESDREAVTAALDKIQDGDDDEE